MTVARAQVAEGDFVASNGIRVRPGGFRYHEDRDRDAEFIAALREAEAAGFDTSFDAQRKHAFTPTPPPPLVRGTLADWLETWPQAPGFAIECLVPQRVVTLLGGHGGVGKSIIALILACHAAAGRPVFGHATTQCHVAFASLEDPGGVVAQRVRLIVAAYGLDESAVAAHLVIVAPPEGADPVLASEFNDMGTRRLMRTAVYEELVEQAKGCGLIVVDNASDAFDGNENDRRQVRAFVRMLQEIAQANDAGLILLAHIDKNAARFGGAGNTYSGSTAWHNSTRSRLVVTDKQGTVELSQEKLNFGRKREQPILLKWSDDHHTLMPADAETGPLTIAGDAEAVLAAIRKAAASGGEVREARFGPATTQRTLETYGLPAHLRGSSGRIAFWSAFGSLQNASRIHIIDGRTSGRQACRLVYEVGASVSGAQQYPTPRGSEPSQPSQRVSVPAGFDSSREPSQTLATLAAAEYREAADGE